MRRRIRSAAALRFHRHSVPQVVVDAGLVALAYHLAYLLRFDGDVPGLYPDLFSRTIAFVVFVNVPASVLVLYGLLMLLFIGGSRFLVHMLYERPLRGFRARRDALSVLIVG